MPRPLSARRKPILRKSNKRRPSDSPQSRSGICLLRLFLCAESMSIAPSSALLLPNIRRFLLFRALFNARFYYPVFTVLFLDFGLSLEQFALLNTAWAFAIVLAEVPSGALADLWGRKRLLVMASALLALAMLLPALAPAGSPLVFWFFLLNCILGGLAEAMSSGSDEALAYDSLVERGLTEQWPLVLDRKMRAQSLAFILAMTLGAAVYDHEFLNRLCTILGLPVHIGHGLSMRLPLILSCLFAVAATVVTLGMREPLPAAEERSHPQARHALFILSLRTWHAALWVLRTPFALAILLLTMSMDHTLRMLATLTSPYYRLIGLPDSSFGLIGSAIAVLGLAVPRLARLMVERFPPACNALFLGLAMLAILCPLVRFIPLYGVLPMAGVFIGMMLCSFFASHYLNAITSSARRATVLSFKGMACNVAFGCIGMGFAALTHHERLLLIPQHPDAPAAVLEQLAFKAALGWAPGYLAAALLAACLPALVALFWQRPSPRR